MAEEQRWEEGHRLCANDCGFFGSPATMDLCSKCYSDHQRMKEEGQAQAAAAASASWSSSSASSPSSSTSAASAGEGGRDAAAEAAGSSSSAEGGEAAAAASGPRRCASCRKRVGLTGFECRCGATFCGVHRYPERHGCGFDYRAAGRDAIARANPVVKGDKLHHKI